MRGILFVAVVEDGSWEATDWTCTKQSIESAMEPCGFQVELLRMKFFRSACEEMTS